MAIAKKVETPEYDRDAWEYLTYAPGHQCSACTRTVKPLEPVRRGAGEEHQHDDARPGRALDRGVAHVG